AGDESNRRGGALVRGENGRGTETEPDPGSGRLEAGVDPGGGGGATVADSARPGGARLPLPAGAGTGQSDREGVCRDQGGQADSGGTGVSVSADVAADGAGGREQGLDGSQRVRQGTGGLRQELRFAGRRGCVPLRTVRRR